MNTNTLSEKATEIVQKLQNEIAQVIERDRVREPKLNPDEKQEVTHLESEIAKYQPWVEKLKSPLEQAQARLVELQRNYQEQVFEEKRSIEEVAHELQFLPQLVEVLENTYSAALRRVATAEHQIKRIKEAARERETRHGQL